MGTSIQNLFSVEPTLPSVQTVKMPEDVGRWAEVITNYLKQKFPDITTLGIEVGFQKKDEKTGTAIGAAYITDVDQEKTVCLPLIIKRFEMSPIDVWMEKKTQAAHPLTPDTFKEVFFSTSPVEALDNRPSDSAGEYFNDPSMWTSTYPPLQGRYSYASAGYNILDAISDTITKEDLDSFKNELRSNPELLIGYEKRGHIEIITKLAKKSQVNTNDFVASAMKLIPMSVVDVKKEGPDKYSIISTRDGVFDLSESIDVDKEQCKKHLSKITAHVEDILNEVDQSGEKMLVIGKPAPGVFLYEDMSYNPEEAKEFGAYYVKNKAGQGIEGIVIPNVISLDGKKKNVKLFLHPANSTMQTNIVGVKNNNSKVFTKCLEPQRIRVGQTGTFVFVDDGKALAIEPITIKAVEKGSDKICAYTLDGKKVTVKLGWGEDFLEIRKRRGVGEKTELAEPVSNPSQFKREQIPIFDIHGFVEVRPDEYIIPRRMVWIPMEGFNDVSSTADEWMLKEAAALHAGKDQAELLYTGVVYELSRQGMPKMAMDSRNTKVMLASLGLDQEKIARAMKKSRDAGKCRIVGVKKLASKEGFVGKAKETYNHLQKISSGLKRSLLKEAAKIESPETVDALLSLKFLNPDNLAKFMAYRPVFEKVADYLAELVLASRLGLKDVEEAAAVGAMSKLMEVVEGLKKTETAMYGASRSRAVT